MMLIIITATYSVSASTQKEDKEFSKDLKNFPSFFATIVEMQNHDDDRSEWNYCFHDNA